MAKIVKNYGHICTVGIVAGFLALTTARSAMAVEPSQEYTAKDLYIPYPGSAMAAPEDTHISVGAFIAHLKSGSWEQVEDQPSSWIYRIDTKDQLTGKVGRVSLQFEPSPVPGGILLSRGLNDNDEMSAADIFASFGSVIATVTQESAQLKAQAQAQAQAQATKESASTVGAQPDANSGPAAKVASDERPATETVPPQPAHDAPVQTSHPQSHCTSGETIFFSCQLNRTRKFVSICGSADLSSSKGYLQYRFGPIGSLEIAVPAIGTRPNEFFALSHTQYTRSGQFELAFKRGKLTYRLSRLFSGPDDSNDSSSLTAENGAKTVFTDNCSGAIDDSLFSGSDASSGEDHLANLIGVKVLEKEDSN